jgi:hypothetical protein
MKIAFLFNHDQTHQVGHALPIALALRARHRDLAVTVITTNDTLSEAVRRISTRAGDPIEPVQIGLRRASTRLASACLEAIVPVSKLGVYRDNLDLFAQFDALVVAEKTSLLLKTRYGLDDLKIIHTRHGAGDRAIGFNKASAGFDHVLVSGEKIRERLIREAGVPGERLSTVGYPKFDIMPPEGERLPFRDPGRPTVLYNPHPSPHLSSWYKHGRQVLEHFLRDDRYNLIFAPHVMLFHRRFVVTIDKLRVDRPGRIDRRFYQAPNIHIDLGSTASTDMTYTAAADIYLGDASSQVYEFLRRPRACVFLNSHDYAHEGDANFAHWKAGQVIADPAHLAAALDRARVMQPFMAPIQEEMFARSVELTEERSSDRAARAIRAALGLAPSRGPVDHGVTANPPQPVARRAVIAA